MDENSDGTDAHRGPTPEYILPPPAGFDELHCHEKISGRDTPILPPIVHYRITISYDQNQMGRTTKEMEQTPWCLMKVSETVLIDAYNYDHAMKAVKAYVRASIQRYWGPIRYEVLNINYVDHHSS